MYITNKYFRNNSSKVEFIKTVRKAFDICLKEALDIVKTFDSDYDEVRDTIHTVVHDYEAFNLIRANQPQVTKPENNSHDELILETKELLKKAVDQSNYLMVRSLLNTLEEQLELG